MSLVNEMSRQVDWSSGPPCAEGGEGVAGCDEAELAELGDGVCRDVSPDGDLSLEQPAATTAKAATAATVIGVILTGHSFCPRWDLCCTPPAIDRPHQGV